MRNGKIPSICETPVPPKDTASIRVKSSSGVRKSNEEVECIVDFSVNSSHETELISTELLFISQVKLLLHLLPSVVHVLPLKSTFKSYDKLLSAVK